MNTKTQKTMKQKMRVMKISKYQHIKDHPKYKRVFIMNNFVKTLVITTLITVAINFLFEGLINHNQLTIQYGIVAFGISVIGLLLFDVYKYHIEDFKKEIEDHNREILKKEILDELKKE